MTHCEVSAKVDDELIQVCLKQWKRGVVCRTEERSQETV